jgi:hypothetical protein
MIDIIIFFRNFDMQTRGGLLRGAKRIFMALKKVEASRLI